METPFYLKDGHGATSVLQSDKLNKSNQIFIISAIEKVIKSKYSYNNKATKIELKNTFISLPIKNGKVDYNFMESFINTIEEEHIAQLNTYLVATGLKNYTLTKEEEKALNDYEKNNINLGVFKIEELFKIQNTKSFNKNKLVKGNEYDYVTRTSQNQGILQKTGFVNKKNINSSGIWSLGLLQMDFFYRKKPWYAGQFIRKVTSKIELKEATTFYFSTLLNKQKKKLLSVLVRDVDEVFLKSELSLPILADGRIDFIFMETLISAIQKLIIKDVVMYTNKKSENTTLTLRE